MKRFMVTFAIVFPALAAFAPVGAQQASDPAARIAAQQQAMRPLSAIDGEWRGTTTEYRSDGTKLERGYVERVTPLLDGTLKLLEGSKESVTGADDFHVICVLSHDPETKQYTMRAWYPEGAVFDVAFDADAGTFGWHADRPGGARIVATGAIDGGVWRERIEFTVPGQAPRLLEERVLKRVGNGD